MSSPHEGPDLSVVVPAFEEEARIADSLARVAAFLEMWPGGGEIIVVDDGSRDATFSVVEGLLGRLPVSTRLHRHPENMGKGAAVRSGMIRSRGRLAGFIDADLSYPPEVFTDFAQAISEGADVVVGRRTGAPPSPLRRAAHVAFGAVVRLALRIPVTDTQCGVKLFRGEAGRALFAHTRSEGFGFDPEVLLLAVRWGLQVVEVDAPLIRAPSTSTVRLAHDIPGMLADLVRARLRRTPCPPGS